MTCHQGRESTTTVVAALAAAGATDEDTVYASLAFSDVHYLPAAATLYAGKVKGGYQYATVGGVAKAYDWRFRHVPGYDTCVGCHDPHTLDVKISECQTCHPSVTDLASLQSIRMVSSATLDFDGDGNTTEGVAHEIEGLRAKLLQAIQAYTDEKALADVCYDQVTYPYWFIDDGDGVCSGAEAVSGNQYASYTPRLLKATYNYQLSMKDPGNYAHNAKYTLQLLFDSIEDLNTELGTPVDMALATRTDGGHFDGSTMPSRNWDSDAAVGTDCSPCHSGQGYGGTNFAVSYADMFLPAQRCPDLPVYRCVRELVMSGVMPPNVGCTGDPVVDVDNQACLSQNELNLLEVWVGEGAPE